MARFEFEDLAAYEDPDRIWIEAPTDEIGAVEMRREAQAMRIEIIDGVPVFAGEEKVDLYGVLRELGGHSWWRMEVRVPAGGMGRRPRKDDVLSVGEYPWRGWTRQARFRSGQQKGSVEYRETLARDGLAETMAAVEDAEHANHEPFSSNSKEVVAGLSSPQVDVEISNRKLAERSYLLGVCSDPVSVVEMLVDDARLAKLIPMALEGKLQDFKREGKAIGGRFDAVSDQSVVESILNDAIWEAMAGPKDKKQSRRLEGKPVASLVEDIFCFHLREEQPGRGARRLESTRLQKSLEQEPGRRDAPSREADPEDMERIEAKLASDLSFRRDVATYLAREWGGRS